jgi:hypothetical protein
VPENVLVELRALLGDGLFTAYDTEKNWWMAHRILVPTFGPLGLRKMFDDMLEISTQMVLKWDRLGSDHSIDCSDDFTRYVVTITLFKYGITLRLTVSKTRIRHHRPRRLQLTGTPRKYPEDAPTVRRDCGRPPQAPEA